MAISVHGAIKAISSGCHDGPIAALSVLLGLGYVRTACCQVLRKRSSSPIGACGAGCATTSIQITADDLQKSRSVNSYYRHAFQVALKLASNVKKAKLAVWIHGFLAPDITFFPLDSTLVSSSLVLLRLKLSTMLQTTAISVTWRRYQLP